MSLRTRSSGASGALVALVESALTGVTATAPVHIDSTNPLQPRVYLTASEVTGLPNSATTAVSTNTASAIVARDGSGNFAAGTITAAQVGNVTGNASGTAATFTGNLTGDVTSSGMVTTIGAGAVSNAMLAGSIADSKFLTISTIGKVANSATTATDANTASAIVARDASGNFTAGTITANLTGNASGTAATFTGNLTGNVTSSGMSTTIATGVITNAMVNTSAAIAYSKLSLGTSIVNADISTTAAIAYSKLNLATSIVDADVSASAAIAYSKLNLGTSIVNADVSTSAAIAYSKLALTGAVLNADLAGSIAYSKLSLTGAILNADLAGSIAYSKLSLTGAILNADLAGSIAYSKLSLGTSIVNADISTSAAIAYSKLSLGTSIVNADISTSAAIAYSKLSLTGAVLNADLAGSIADSKLSTISTALKVSNSATTATDANTASAIVARDASGNFTAGTITASVFKSGTANPAATGVIRLANADTLVQRNAANSADITVLSNDGRTCFGASNQLVGIIAGTLYLDGTDFYLRHQNQTEYFHISNGNIQFSQSTACKLFITDKTTNNATANNLTIQAQNETGTTSTGGDLILASGTGTTVNGFINFNNIVTGTTAPSAGSAGVLPAFPTGYATFKVNGTSRQIAYY